MMRVTIEIVPHGEEDAKFTLHTIEIAQVEKLDTDPYGLRGYAAWLTNGPTECRTFTAREPDAKVIHRRSDGALWLTRLLLRRLVSK